MPTPEENWDAMVIELAGALLNIDEGLDPSNAYGHQIKQWKHEKHSGDCTNECHSCARCIADREIKVAERLAGYLDLGLFILAKSSSQGVDIARAKFIIAACNEKLSCDVALTTETKSALAK